MIQDGRPFAWLSPKLVILFAVIAATVTVAAACGGSSAKEPEPTPTVTPIPPTATRGPQDYRGFVFPIKGGCLPTSDTLIPGAPREYRNGTHEGLDFYSFDNCTDIQKNTPIVAAKAGKVVRADVSFRDLTQDELDQLYARLEGLPNGDAAVLDRFRGRQIWIEHGQGVITRYAHLEGIAEGIREGVIVKAGDVIGYVGESGTPESVTNPGYEYHLHFEIRVGDGFLGEGLPPGEVRSLYQVAFSQ